MSTAAYELVLQFDTAWKRWKLGQESEAPQLASFLPADEASRKLVLVDLAEVDFDRRLDLGEEVQVEEYLARFPELRHIPEAVVRLVAVEWQHRLENGVRPSIEEYLERFPEEGDRLRKRLADMSVAASAATHPSATTTGDANHLPERIGKYELRKQLGEGAFFVVVLGFDSDLNRHVAIKVLKTGCLHAQTLLEEARRQVSVRHPNVVTVLEASGRFIVYEYCGGGSLSERLKQQGRMAPREAASLIADLADALQYFHERELYHLDIKPSNILFDESGRPLLSDFGLAVRDEELDSVSVCHPRRQNPPLPHCT